jgi:hypothetical protein
MTSPSAQTGRSTTRPSSPVRVGRIEPDGTHTTAANLPLGVNPIAFSDDGRLFVGLAAFGDDALYEVDPDGVAPPRLINTGLGLDGFDWLDGFLYAPRMSAGEVVRIDVDSGAYTVVTAIATRCNSGDPSRSSRFSTSGAVNVVQPNWSCRQRHTCPNTKTTSAR